MQVPGKCRKNQFHLTDLFPCCDLQCFYILLFLMLDHIIWSLETWEKAMHQFLSYNSAKLFHYVSQTTKICPLRSLKVP